jgi:hypothetical protein
LIHAFAAGGFGSNPDKRGYRQSNTPKRHQCRDEALIRSACNH